MVLEAYILGSGGMMPLPKRHLTSVLLRREGELFLFDCGEGTQVSLRSLNLRWKKISAIFISHTHADHLTGLPGMLMLSAQVERHEPLTIIGPSRVAEFVHEMRRVLEMYINYPIVVEEIKNPHQEQVVYRGESYQIRAFPLRHTRLCVGYAFEERARPGRFFPELATAQRIPRGPLWSRLQEGHDITLEDGRTIHARQVMGTSRRGRKFVYITDSLAFPELFPHIARADLLVCEGMFEKALAEISHSKGHMTAEDAGLLAKQSGDVLKLALVHFSPRYTSHQLTLLEQEAQVHFPAAFAARDRQLIPIPFREEEELERQEE